MKYIILILLTSFLFNPCFAEEGYGNYYPSASSIPQIQAISDENLNGFVVVSSLNDFYALPVQVKDKQVVLKQNQSQFLLSSIKANGRTLSLETEFPQLRKQAVVVNPAYYSSELALKKAGVFAKAHSLNNGIPQNWNEIRAVLFEWNEVKEYNFITVGGLSPDKIKKNSSIKNNKFHIGPNGGGGAYKKQFAFHQNNNPGNVHWQMTDNIPAILAEWGKIYEIPREELLEIITGGQPTEAQQREAFPNDIISDNYDGFIVSYDGTRDLDVRASNALSLGDNKWNSEFVGINMFQGMKGKQKALAVLNDFSNEIKSYQLLDGKVYVIGPNGGGGAYIEDRR